MEVAIAGGLCVGAAVVFVALAISWWAFRKTLTLVRRLLLLVMVGLVLSLGITGAAVALYLFGQVDGGPGGGGREQRHEARP
jgi:hypothetical protein